MARPRHTLFLFGLAAVLLILTLPIRPAQAAPTPISFGATMAGSISTQGEQDAFTFMAATGDVVVIRLTTESDFWPEITLYDPSGSPLASSLEVGPTLVEIKEEQLPADGYYQVTVSDYNGTGTGTYWIFVQRLNNPGGAAQVEFGETLSAAITSTCQEHTYRFEAFQGTPFR